MKNVSLLILVACTLAMSACSKLKKIEGNGNMVTTDFDVNAFDRCSFDGSMHVVLHESPENRISVTTDANIMEHVEVFVTNTEVKVELSDEHFRYDPSEFTVHVYAPVLRFAGMDGSGSIACADTLHASSFELEIDGSGSASVIYLGQKLTLDISGSGEIEAKGTADQAYYDISGSGTIKANPVQANRVHAGINGSGRIYTTVIQQLFAEINGSGTVYYQGSPVVNTSINGSGRVMHH